MKRKHRPFLLVMAMVLAGCGGNVSVTSPSKPQRLGVVFVGDSIFARWPLEVYFPNRGFINSGIDGERTDEVLARLPDVLSGANVCTKNPSIALTCNSMTPPATVVIYAGWNDVFQLVDPQVAIANLNSIAQECLHAGVHPILVTPYRFDPAFPHFTPNPFDAPIDQIDQGVRDIGTNLGILVIPLDAVFAGQSGYTLDDVHPNATGYTVMRDAFVPFIGKL
ncbi:MAG TPA: GDSL-type esterase/lipase family protein [Candidatus Angelobacter sp.]|nr:GDSL-type esterase/lipase family protein [Candidatus Angelobacter sp.]